MALFVRIPEFSRLPLGWIKTEIRSELLGLPEGGEVSDFSKQDNRGKMLMQGFISLIFTEQEALVKIATEFVFIYCSFYDMLAI